MGLLKVFLCFLVFFSVFSGFARDKDDFCTQKFRELGRQDKQKNWSGLLESEAPRLPPRQTANIGQAPASSLTESAKKSESILLEPIKTPFELTNPQLEATNLRSLYGTNKGSGLSPEYRTQEYAIARQPPQTLSMPPRALQLPVGTSKERIQGALPFIEKIPAIGPATNLSTAKLASGSFSEVVSLTNKKIPSDIAKNLEARQKFVEANSDWVIKLRKFQDNSKEEVKQYAESIRTDLVMHQVATNLASQAKYQGQGFIEVAKIVSAETLHARGIIVQEAVHGVQTNKLQIAIEDFLSKRKPDEKEAFRASSSWQVLVQAGVVQEGEKITSKTTENVFKMDKKMRALEEFYMSTHHDVLKFREDNNLLILGNRAVENGRYKDQVEAIGLDYNHGVNVIWDPKKQKFVMIDY